MDGLLFVSSLPEAGSNGRRPARRQDVPAGRPGSRSRPPFFAATGGTWWLASSPGPSPASDQPGLPLPPPPLPTLHTPPRVRPGAATLPAPLTDFMAEAMSSYLSACSARRARCSSCSRSPIAASVVAAGLGTLRPSEREEGGGRGAAPGNARALRVGNLKGAAAASHSLARPLWATAGLASAAPAGRRLAPRAQRTAARRDSRALAACPPPAAPAARAPPPGSAPRAAAAACACARGRQGGGGAAETAGEGRGRCSPAFYF